jgi:hypothetical protein
MKIVPSPLLYLSKRCMLNLNTITNLSRSSEAGVLAYGL